MYGVTSDKDTTPSQQPMLYWSLHSGKFDLAKIQKEDSRVLTWEQALAFATSFRRLTPTNIAHDAALAKRVVVAPRCC